MSDHDSAAVSDTVQAVVRLVPRMNAFLLQGLIEADALSRSRGSEQIRIQDVIDAFHGHKPNVAVEAFSEGRPRPLLNRLRRLVRCVFFFDFICDVGNDLLECSLFRPSEDIRVSITTPDWR